MKAKSNRNPTNILVNESQIKPKSSRSQAKPKSSGINTNPNKIKPNPIKIKPNPNQTKPESSQIKPKPKSNRNQPEIKPKKPQRSQPNRSRGRARAPTRGARTCQRSEAHGARVLPCGGAPVGPCRDPCQGDARGKKCQAMT